MWIHDADAHVYRIEVETEVEVDAHGAICVNSYMDMDTL
jgi:hypothetical protein